jgi:pantoate--beta-alanine ligase
MTEIAHSLKQLRQAVAGWHRQGLRVGYVPTMGALHDGHLSLIKTAHKNADRIAASIFVNPTQFGPGEDLDAYPRDVAGDLEKLKAHKADLLFLPTLEEIYPDGFATRVSVDGLTDILCGASRPGHFDAVATIVTKLLNQAQADCAVFGEKDYQQLLVIRRLVRDLDINTEIIASPIVRDTDGLALSSRNAYLDKAERKTAGQFNVILRQAADGMAGGDEIDAALSKAKQLLEKAGVARIDYLDVLSGRDLAATQGRIDPAEDPRLFGAIFVGKTRLIDNMAVRP